MSPDRLRYFRIEARELLDGLQQGVLELERAGASPERVTRLLRAAHTLKGAARVVQQAAVAQAAHAFEQVLGPYKEGGAPPREAVDQLLGQLDAIAGELAALEPAPAAPAAPEGPERVRVELAALDALIESVAAATVLVDGMREALTAHAEPELVDRADRAHLELMAARDQAMRLRLLPVGGLFAQLERTARDAATAQEKQVEFRAQGAEARIEAHVLLRMRDALVHVVRNAVVHGIEPPGERVRAGKPPAGQVTVEVERRGHRAVFRVRDDGRGIDLEAARRVAVERGLLSAEEAAELDVPRTLALLFRPGFSTAGTATQLAGHGIGLDVLRDTVLALKGEVSAQSEPGRGTSLEASVPVSLTSFPALIVEAGDRRVAIPLDAVTATMRLTEAALARSAHGDALLHEDALVPFAPLGRLLGSERPASAWSAVVVRSALGTAVLGADRLLEVEDIVLKPLPSTVGKLPLVAGASFDAEGLLRPVLDPLGLVQAAQGSAPVRRPSAVRRPRILVIDDSLTTRMLEQSILEAAGYEVALAASAEEGLETARQGAFDLFLVDVEMPGLDGFGFVAATREDPALRAVPAVLLTSRGAPEDRRRGMEVGARAYLVKGEFEQERFLQVVQGLVG